MAATNTQAGIFTRVPRQITKTWTRKLVSSRGDTLEHPPNQYVHSPVESIQFSVNFTSVATDAPTVFHETDDVSNDRMPFLQQQRKLYNDIESAVQSIIDRYAGELTEVARRQGVSAVEIPGKRSTRYSMEPQTPEASPPRSRLDHFRERDSDHVGDYAPSTVSRVKTITPSDIITPFDSMSNADEVRSVGGSFHLDQLAKVVAEMSRNDKAERRANRRRYRNTSSNRSRSRSRARTVMNYAAGTKA